jgi:hypothetical protein
MSLIHADRPDLATTASAAEPLGLWQRLAQAVDEYFTNRSMRALRATTMQRCRRDASRFRRLLQSSSEIAPAAPTVAGTRDSP